MFGTSRAAPGTGVPVIEFVGPAGAGKSTIRARVRATLGGANGHQGVRERTGARTMALALRHAGDWLPATVALLHSTPPLAGPLLRHLVRLRTLATELPRMRAAAQGALLLEEGPVLSLALVNRTATLVSTPMPALERFRGEALAWWGAALDIVVYLDATDAVLARRIVERAKPHRMKGRSERDVRDFLAWYRWHYAELTREFAGRGVRIVRFDTAAQDTEAIAAQVTALVGEHVNAD